MARFFLDLEGLPLDKSIAITSDDAAHIAKALRLQPGEQIEVVIAGQAYSAQLTQIAPDLVLADVGEQLAISSESGVAVHLYQGLPKGDKLDLVIQKATELGVTTITPVLTERVVVKLKPDAVAKKLQRWQRIALEAAKQSRRLLVPQVYAPTNLRNLPMLAKRELALVAWEEETTDLKPLLQTSAYDAVHVFVGPEGGLASSEVEFLLERGWLSVALGPRILRTETAPIALMAVIQYELGDLGGSR
jgi:16S rRNA (uracil1498-N3)-methyltransferase